MIIIPLLLFQSGYSPPLTATAAATTTTTGIPRACTPPHHHTYHFCNTSLSIDERIHDLIDRLTLDEKPFLLVARESPKGNISRLGIPEYDWGGNCMHGVQSMCYSSDHCPTSFPNPNTLGSTFNTTLWHRMGQVIGLELRALWLQNVGEYHPSSGLPHIGLDCWSPNVQIQRDPRWGRNMESPSEDPLVCGEYGTQHTLGLQQNPSSKNLQAVATLKHFAVNSLEGPWFANGTYGGSITRHSVNALVSLFDLHSSYLKPFEMTVKNGEAAGIMCSYNRINGVPSCANEILLKQILRENWNFDGYVSSDSGAIDDIQLRHAYTNNWNSTIRVALQAGCDIESASWGQKGAWRTGGKYIDYIPHAVRSGVLDEALVNEALYHALRIRFRLGLFDNDAIDNDDPLWNIPISVIESPSHVELAMEATAQGFVLLKNEANLLPLDTYYEITTSEKDSRSSSLTKQTTSFSSRNFTIAMIGPHIYSRHIMLGNYLGEMCYNDTTNACVTNFVEGMELHTSQEANVQIIHTMGCSVHGNSTEDFDKALHMAQTADVVVYIGGLDLSIEGEERDRADIRLPLIQRQLLRELIPSKKLLVVLLHGGIVGLDDDNDDDFSLVNNISTLITVGYPGKYASTALASALWGTTSRAWGRLAVTWYPTNVVHDQLNMVNFDMTQPPGRTYRYFDGKSIFPFGYGLNPLTHFEILNAQVINYQNNVESTTTKLSCKLTIQIQNMGTRKGDDVILVYFSPSNITVPSPSARLRKQLFGFRRLSDVEPNQVRTISIPFRPFELYNTLGQPIVVPGLYQIIISNGNNDIMRTVQIHKENKSVWIEPTKASVGSNTLQNETLSSVF